MLKENQKYFDWLYSKKRYYHLFNVSSGLFVWIFLWVTQPFGISDNNLGNFLTLGLFLLPFGLVWILGNYLVDFLYYRVLSLKNSLLSWVFKILVQVHSIYFLRIYFCEGPCIDTAEYFQIWLAVITLFFLMYIPFSLYGRYHYFHYLLIVGESDSDRIDLKGDGKEHLSINPDEIIFIRSDDNYVDIYLANDRYPGKKIIFRSTLKSIESQLEPYPQFIRTHRSILVNLKYVSLNTSSVNKLKLSFLDFDEEVPVSKSYRKEVSRMFIHPE